MSIGVLKIEVSPTSKCHCFNCDTMILKGTYRLTEKFGSGRWQKVRRYCTKCGREHLAWIVKELTEKLALFGV